MTARKAPEPEFGAGVLPLRVELSAETYGRLDQIAQTWHMDAHGLAARLIERGVKAIWTASSVASLAGLTPAPKRQAATPAAHPHGPGSKPRVTDDQLVRIRRLAAEGIPLTVIATQLDLSTSTVRKHVGKLRNNHLSAAPSERISA